jgi:hypothetical protein
MTGRVGRRVQKGDWSEKANGRIKNGKDISPSDVRSRVRGSSRVEKDTITEINDAIGRGREAMPKEPPSTGWVKKGGVVGVFVEEMTVVAAVSRTGKGSRVTTGLRKVNLNEVPAGLKYVGGSVGNAKEAIRGRLDGSIKRSSSNQRNRNSRIVIGKNWDSSVNWDGSDEKREGRQR